MEKIKRANNIWTNDSLFLRDFLLIPVDRSPMQESKPLTNGDSSVAPMTTALDADEMFTQQDLLHCGRMSRSLSKDKALHKITARATPSPEIDSATTASCSDLSVSDFLNRFDSSMKEIKTSIQELEAKSK